MIPRKSIIPESIEIECQDCGKPFRWFPSSTIKPVRCKICENKKLLARSTLYDKKPKERHKPIVITTKKAEGIKSPKIVVKKKKEINLDKHLDSAWSLLVKLKAGMQCEYCKTRLNLNSHHIYSRANKAGKWFVPNGICLCVGHHIGNTFSAHKTSVDFTMWLIQYKGQKFMDDLKLKVKSTYHWTDFEKRLLLKELKKEIKELQIKYPWK
jgi:hypothetical protein